MIWGFGISRGKAGNALACLLLATTALGNVTPAAAQEAERAARFDIPAQSLADALALFGRQSDMQVTASNEIVAGKTSASVSGNLAPASALSRLLTGTGLTFRFIGASSVRIERAPQSADGAVQLGPVRVEGANGRNGDGYNGVSSDPGATEGTKSYAGQAITIGKAAQSLKDTPQSVTVMTRQLIDDQRLDTLSDLMIRTPGLVLTTDSNARDIVYSRGFEVRNVQLDGVSISYDAGFRPNVDLAIYDRVEVLRGADGLFSGTGQPGGTLNLVRKRPLASTQLSILGSAGSWSNYRLEGDATGPLGFDGHLRGRVVGVYQNRDFFYSPGDEEKILIYGVIEADLGPNTLVSVGGSYLKQKGTTWYFGLPRYADGGDLGLPRSQGLAPEWAVRDQTTKEYFGSFEQSLGQDWSLKVKASRQEYDSEQIMFGLQGSVKRDDPRMTNISAGKSLGGNKASTIDVNLTGGFDLLGQRHQLVVGADWQRSHGVDMRYFVSTQLPSSVSSIFDFDPSQLSAPVIGGISGGWPAYGAKQMGIYGKLQAQLGSNLRLIVGGRYSDHKFTSRTEEYDEAGNLIYNEVTDTYRDKGIFTPYSALVYAIDGRWSLYGSVAEIHQPQANYLQGPLPGTTLPAIKGRNYEIGIKGALRDDTLNLSLAFYRIERKGQAVEDPDYPWMPGNLGLSCCYLARGKVVSQGVDAEISGELLPGWQVQFGYTYNHNRDKDGGVPYHAVTPEHLLKIWTSYTLPGRLSDWMIGAGITAQSKQFNAGQAWNNDPVLGWQRVAYRVDQKGYVVANMSVDYRVNANWSAVLNLNNVFDKTYYQTIGNNGNGNWYGMPRNFLLTLRGQY